MADDADPGLSLEVVKIILGANLTGITLGCLVTSLALATLLSPAAQRCHVFFRNAVIVASVLYVGLVICLWGDTLEIYGQHFGDRTYIAGFSKFFCVYEAFNGSVSAVVQAAFAFRAYRLVESPVWLGPILAVFPLTTAGAWYYVAFRLLVDDDLLAVNFAGRQLTYIAPAVGDVTIMALCCYGLWKIHARTSGSTPRGRALILRMAALTLGSNTLATMICIWQLINSYTGFDALYFLDVIIPALYLFSLCGWLFIRQRMSEEETAQSFDPPSPKLDFLESRRLSTRTVEMVQDAALPTLERGWPARTSISVSLRSMLGK